MRQINLFIACMLLPLAWIAAGQPAEKPKLTIEKIMQEPSLWIGSLPENIYWSEDGKWIYFNRNPQNEVRDPLYRISPEGDTPQRLTLEQERELPAARGTYSQDRTRKVYVKNDHLYLHHIAEGTISKLVSGTGRISDPAFSAKDQAIIFTMEGNLWKYEMDNGMLEVLATFKKGNDSKENRPASKHDQWLKDQQMELFKILRNKNNRQQARKDIREQMRPEYPKTIYTGDASATNIRLSPDQRFITYNLYKRNNKKSTEITHFVNESGYVENQKARSKVGGNAYSYGLCIYDTKRDSGYSVQTEKIPGISEQPDFLKDYDAYKPKGDPRDVLIFGPHWSADGRHAIVSVRSADNKDRWIMMLDMETGEPRMLDRQRDEAWIAGPGIGGYGWSEAIGWLPDNKHIWFQSEASGYSHLYTLNINNGKKKQLTRGKWEVYGPRISNDKQHWYLTANKEHPGERHLYRMPLKGGRMERLTRMEGRNDAVLSPDEKYIAIRHSYSNQPWELYVKKNAPQAQAKKLTRSLTSQFKAYPWRDPQLVTFEAEDGAEVHARLYRPEKPVKNGPAVIFVHGAGYLQNAHKWWSNYYREYMFHNLLADKGYTILDIDYRGSAGYGRDWRTAIYRHMGGKDLSDHVDGARFLAEKYDVDPEKIGIYGGSYGGFITLMALFKNPKSFAAGAALRSVTDWAHYNHGYTSNILNEPAKDSLAYRRSSPIYFAEGLQDPLLICHGMIDDNVQFQDVVRLSQRLIELGKEDWEMAVYPLERHGFVHPSSWTDEYRRIYNLFEENLK